MSVGEKDLRLMRWIECQGPVSLRSLHCVEHQWLGKGAEAETAAVIQAQDDGDLQMVTVEEINCNQILFYFVSLSKQNFLMEADAGYKRKTKNH